MKGMDLSSFLLPNSVVSGERDISSVLFSTVQKVGLLNPLRCAKEVVIHWKGKKDDRVVPT